MIYKRSIVNCTNNRINKSQLARYKNIVDIPSKMGLYIPQKERKIAKPLSLLKTKLIKL